MSTGLRPRLRHARRDVLEGRQDHRPAGRRDRRPRRVRLAPRSRPSSRPASSTSCCGSYDLQAAHVKVKAVYTNKAPGGVAYRCSFRITEAVYLVERMVDALALEMGVDPIDLRMHSFIAPEQFPYETTTGWTYDSGNYAEDDARGDGDRRLRGSAPRAGREARPRRADGHRRVVLHRGRRRRPAQAHGHPRAGDERRRRPARAPVGQGVVSASAPRPRARATRRRSRRSSPRSSGSRPRTSRSATATPTSRPTGSAPTAAARRRSPARRSRSSRARCATRRA